MWDNTLVAQTIAFNADDRQKILAEVLAKRLGYANVSDMLRDWLESGFNENITVVEQEQIMAFYKPKSAKEKSLPKGHSRRAA